MSGAPTLPAQQAELVKKIKDQAEHWAYMERIDHEDAAQVAKDRHAELVAALASGATQPDTLAKVHADLQIMVASAEPEGDAWVTGYRIKTGALHRIVGTMQGAGYALNFPAVSMERLKGIASGTTHQSEPTHLPWCPVAASVCICGVEDDEATPPTGEPVSTPCDRCGQVDNGQVGEHPCAACGLPMTWGEAPPTGEPLTAPSALSVDCPHCWQKAGAPCIWPETRESNRDAPHEDRKAAALAATAAPTESEPKP